MPRNLVWAWRVLWHGPAVLFTTEAFREIGGDRNTVLAQWDGDGQLQEIRNEVRGKR